MFYVVQQSRSGGKWKSMAIIGDVNPEMEEGWRGWVRTRPDHVRTLIEKRDFTPWKLYRMKSTGHRVILRAFDEELDGRITLKVTISSRFNLVAFERTVFGVDPDDLEECDLPAKSEPHGAALTHEEIEKIVATTSPGSERMAAINEAAHKAIEDLRKTDPSSSS
jgi:hypothetical protein